MQDDQPAAMVVSDGATTDEVGRARTTGNENFGTSNADMTCHGVYADPKINYSVHQSLFILNVLVHGTWCEVQAMRLWDSWDQISERQS